MVGQLTQLDLGELQQSIDTIVEGVVGFAGRGMVITWEDCEAMEGARRKALAKHGSTVTWPRAHVYTETSAGVEGNNHAYQTAAASWMSAMDNALAAPASWPDRGHASAKHGGGDSVATGMPRGLSTRMAPGSPRGTA